MPIFSRIPLTRTQPDVRRWTSPRRRAARGSRAGLRPRRGGRAAGRPAGIRAAAAGRRSGGAAAAGRGQAAAPPPPPSTYAMCYAVSTASDPLGPYYRYEFLRPLFPDYPRPAIWPDGYYIPTSTSDNRISATVATQKHACVVDRAKMLKGKPATRAVHHRRECELPEQRRHRRQDAAAAGRAEHHDRGRRHAARQDRRGRQRSYVWQFHVDWKDPSKTKIDGPAKIEVAPYHYLCGGQLTNCVPQPGTDARPRLAGRQDHAAARLPADRRSRVDRRACTRSTPPPAAAACAGTSSASRRIANGDALPTGHVRARRLLSAGWRAGDRRVRQHRHRLFVRRRRRTSPASASPAVCRTIRRAADVARDDARRGRGGADEHAALAGLHDDRASIPPTTAPSGTSATTSRRTRRATRRGSARSGCPAAGADDDEHSANLRRHSQRTMPSEVARVLEAHPELKASLDEPLAGRHLRPDGAARSRCTVRTARWWTCCCAPAPSINQKSHWWAGGVSRRSMSAARSPPWMPSFLIGRGAVLEIHHAVRLRDARRRPPDARRGPELVHARGGDGQLPLHFAQTVEMAEFLINRGADINARDIDHESTAAQWMVRDRQPRRARAAAASRSHRHPDGLGARRAGDDRADPRRRSRTPFARGEPALVSDVGSARRRVDLYLDARRREEGAGARARVRPREGVPRVHGAHPAGAALAVACRLRTKGCSPRSRRTRRLSATSGGAWAPARRRPAESDEGDGDDAAHGWPADVRGHRRDGPPLGGVSRAMRPSCD